MYSLNKHTTPATRKINEVIKKYGSPRGNYRKKTN